MPSGRFAGAGPGTGRADADMRIPTFRHLNAALITLSTRCSRLLTLTKFGGTANASPHFVGMRPTPCLERAAAKVCQTRFIFDN